MNRLAALLKNKLLVITVVVALLIIVIAFELMPKQYYLTISTTPETASIYINDAYAGVGSVQKRFTQGEYRVKATLEGYDAQEKTVLLRDTTNVTLTLTQTKQTEPLEIINQDSLATAVPASSQNGLLIGLNRNDSLLYLYTNTDAVTLHSTPIEVFSYEHPYIIALEKQNVRDFLIINVDTFEKRKVSLRTLEPVVAANIIPYTAEVYFLARLDATARTTTLFKSDLSFLSPKEIAKTKATDVVALASNTVLLFEQADALDASRVVIYDTEFQTEVIRVAANTYTVSPDKKYIFIKDSQQVSLYNVQTKAITRLPKTGSYFPFFTTDSKPVLLTNTLPGVTLTYLNQTDLRVLKTIVVKELSSNSVRWVAGIQDETLIVADTTNKMWQIKLPTP